jgi:stage II sporulation protein M
MVKKKNDVSLSGRYSSAWAEIKAAKKFIWIIVAVFVLSGIFGYVQWESLTGFDELLAQLVAQVEGMGTWELVWFIFQNNVTSALLGLFLGVVFGIFPVINALTNGAVLGYVLRLTANAAGVQEFWRLLPHGIFELPAIFLSLGLGMRLGGFAFAKKGKRWAVLRERLKEGLWVFVLVVLPLLVVAAVIEGLLIGAGL